MNNSVFEIISQLVKRLLHNDEEMVEDERKLIASLVDKGYGLDEINQAFEFIFSSSEIIDLPGEISENDDLLRKPKIKQRIFNIKEKVRFSLQVQGIIVKLNALQLINEEQLEIIIAKSLAMRSGFIDIDSFKKVLKNVVKDEMKLILIGQKIDGLKSIIKVQGDYLN